MLSRRGALAGLAAAIGAQIMPADAQIVKQSFGGRAATGADVAAAQGFDMLRGQRVGLVTNHTGRVGGRRLVDVLAKAPGVTLAAILTPEHGLTGSAEAGAKVGGGRDPATGIPVHSLYGRTLKPTRAMLDGLDVLVFDMQDIGTRFYTYISTMGLAMQAAAEAGLRFVVLDRPNPLGGTHVSGFVLEPAFASFVGRFAIPIAHGLTVGELARMIKGERLLPGLASLDLAVVPMTGWRRDMLWPDTGLGWVATSPNIPAFETALAYAGTGLFEATTASEGRGTDRPFLTLGHADVDARRVITRLGSGLPGLSLSPIRVRPRVIPGVATTPRFRDREISAVSIAIDQPRAVRPVEAGVHLLAAFQAELSRSGQALVAERSAFIRLAGTEKLADGLARGMTGDDITALWRRDVAAFTMRREPYLLYS